LGLEPGVRAHFHCHSAQVAEFPNHHLHVQKKALVTSTASELRVPTREAHSTELAHEPLDLPDSASTPDHAQELLALRQPNVRMQKPLLICNAWGFV
jgi:hypothetical protein